MHDIDRTQLELEPEFSNLESEQYAEFGEAEWSGESDEAELFGEAEENELANELLEVTDEAELDRFIGSFLGRAAKALGQAFASPEGQAIGGVLKGVMRKALPLASNVIGAAVGGPLGARIASGVTAAAGQALGLESESYGEAESYESYESYEGEEGEQGAQGEYEGARRFVRLAADAFAQAAGAPPLADPHAVAQEAAVSAARRFAPGLLKPGGAGGGASAGQWVRRGNEIVLLGV
jgi:hypothetical protein